MKRLVWGAGAIALLYFAACVALWAYQPRMIFFPNTVVKSTPANGGMTYEEVELPVAGDTVTGWWIPAGIYAGEETPVILYFHGNGSNLGDLVERMRLFYEQGYRVLLIDYRGYGRSGGKFPNERRVYEDAEAAWAYLTQAQQVPGDRIILYGQSLGGAIAMHTASNHPEAAGLVMESSFTSMRQMVNHSYPLLPSVVPVRWILTQRFDSLAKVRSLQIPLLLIHGTADRVVPAQMSQALYDAAGGEKELVWIEGGGHNDLPYREGSEYADSIRGFVERYAE